MYQLFTIAIRKLIFEKFNENKILFKMAAADCNLLNLVKMVCPSREELSIIVNNVKCDQCGLIFKNEPRLRLHDLKVHQRKNLDKTVKEFVRYHCPESKCIYSPESSRFFTTRKYLKQHYLKVHAAKRFQCTQCDKSFSTEAAKTAHLRICGLEFTCVCEKTFNTYEALLTHAKRLSHSVDEKYKNLLKKQTQKLPQTSPQTIQLVSQKRPISILPYEGKALTVQQLNTPVSTCNAETQTDDIKRIRKTLTPSKSSKRRESRQTQTNILAKEKKSKSTVETQTTPSTRESQKKSVTKRLKNPMKRSLQLNEDLTNDNLFPISSVNLQHDVRIQDLWEERATLGTQTNPDEHLLDVFNDSVTQTTFYEDGTMENVFKLDGMSSTSLPYSRNFYRSGSRSDPMLTEETFNDRFSSIETQTEKQYPQSIFDTDSTALLSSSNTETQTTEDFDNIEQLLYSNMCTQTCNDILPSELGLSDIQTQTAWPDLENPSNSKQDDHRHSDEKSDISMNACRSWLHIQTSHTETQTDLLSIFDELQ